MAYPPVTREVFWSRVDMSGNCWIYPGSTDTNGYGRVTINGKSYNAHRFAYIDTYGDLPGDIEVCHTCDNRRCVRPTHLFEGSHLDNMQDASTKGRMRRGSGHFNARLTEDDVRLIRSMYVPRKVTLQDLADRFDVDRKTIHRVVTGEQWSHVDAELQAA